MSPGVSSKEGADGDYHGRVHTQLPVQATSVVSVSTKDRQGNKRLKNTTGFYSGEKSTEEASELRTRA